MTRTERPGHRMLDPMAYIRSLDVPFPGRLPVRPFVEHTDWREETPHLAIGDTPEFSTCTDLVPVSSQPVWDVNGYYRDLGVPWPHRPTKRELQRAYIAVGGHLDQRVTYAFKRLINPVIRAKYDRLPLGKPMDDYYGWKVVEALATAWISEQNAARARGEGDDAEGEMLTVDDYLADLGMPSLEAMEAAMSAVETPEVDSDGEGTVSGDWRWGFYILHSARADTDTLSDWQSMIVSACASRGLRLRLTLGYVGQTAEPWLIRRHSNHIIIFVNDSIQNPSQAHAEAIASSLADRHPTTRRTA